MDESFHEEKLQQAVKDAVKEDRKLIVSKIRTTAAKQYEIGRISVATVLLDIADQIEKGK